MPCATSQVVVDLGAATGAKQYGSRQSTDLSSPSLDISSRIRTSLCNPSILHLSDQVGSSAASLSFRCNLHCLLRTSRPSTLSSLQGV